MKKFIIMIAALALCAVVTQADVIDTTRGSGTSGWVSSSTAVLGTSVYHGWVGGGEDQAGIVVFELPTLTGGNTISGANFEAILTGIGGTSPNADLYVLRASDSSSFTTADYSGGGTLLMSTFFDSSTVGAWGGADTSVNTDGTADASLATWLQSQYTGDTPNNTYAIFRLSANPAGTGGWDGASWNNGTGSTLTIKTVPEPATIGLFGLAGVIALIARRVRRS